MSRTVVLLIVLLVSGTVSSAQGVAASQRGGRASVPSRIYKLEELRAPQIDALDRERTLFILPIGMLEVHGPHLPIGTDILGLTYEANAASQRLRAALTNWNIVMMPPISYGQGGANELGGRLVHPGTYGIRQSTLRSLVADLGGQVAQNGFRWIFVLNGHGAPTHNFAINDACDFVSETFQVTMLHVTGLLRADPSIQAAGQKVNSKYFSASQLSALGLDLHGGVGETSGILAIRPDLVSPQYRQLPSRVGRSVQEMLEIAAAPGWEGYLSDPAKARAAHGRAVEDWWIAGFTELILRALRGENMFGHPRFPDAIPAPAVGVIEKALANEAAFDATLEKWLRQRQRR
jgi:creatinine amidohydrolase